MSDHQNIHASGSNEWYTPEKYIQAALRTMGSIDLDPASCWKANLIVQASAYFTIEDNGLSKRWYGNVWLNPPYGIGMDRAGKMRSSQSIWSEYMIEQFEHFNIDQAIMLINAQTPEQWFKPLWNYPICFTDHRIKFISSDGTKNQPTHGNAFVYFGKNLLAFDREFSQFGTVISRKVYRALVDNGGSILAKEYQFRDDQ